MARPGTRPMSRSTTAAAGLPDLVRGLCDDAAVFPPGLTPLPQAIATYLDRAGSWYHDLAGPLVVAADALAAMEGLLPRDRTLPVSITVPAGPAHIGEVIARAASLPVQLASLEVVLPPAAAVPDALDEIAAALPGADPRVYVEVPRDDRAATLIAALQAYGFRAKLRTGGVRADLYPGEAELAASVTALVVAGLRFKATAGLHHAIRNTDPRTGFEQHGFLNLLLATEALLAGGTEQDARQLLAAREGRHVAARVLALADTRIAATRATFSSFGTCSVTEPLEELISLGLLTPPASATM